MAFTAQQICAQARAIARTPGLTTLNGAAPSSGDLLNFILSDLCQTYDFTEAKGKATVSFTGAVGSGPYNLPADYLRMTLNGVFYFVDGTSYVMISEDLSEFDAQTQNAGISNFPEFFAVDPALTPAGLFVWPPSALDVGATIRYYRQMADIDNPEGSTVVPWFLNSTYLVTRLAGEIMKVSGDARADTYLSDSDSGAQGILRRFLLLEKDDEGRATTVSLDRRRFSSGGFNRLRNTKNIGWLLAIGWLSATAAYVGRELCRSFA